MSIEPRFLNLVDRLIACGLVAEVLGTTLAFGGAVWWARPALAFLTVALVSAWLIRVALIRRWRILKSPLTAIGFLAIALAAAQLVPLPPALARKLSARSHAAFAEGKSPATGSEETTSAEADAGLKTTVSVDRPATLRWLAGASACLALFVVCAHYADRLGRTMVIWGSVVVGFAIVTAVGLAQLAAGAPGLYGMIEPGSGTSLAPTRDDLAASPGRSALRLAADPEHPRRAWPVFVPRMPATIGGLLGGPGAYLAFGSLGLPLTLALLLQIIAPRGSRESIRARLKMSGKGGIVGLLLAVLALGAGLIGFLAGPWLSVPFAVSLLLVGLPSTRGTGLRWSAVGLMLVAIAGLGTGVGWGAFGKSAAAGRTTLVEAKEGWVEASRIARDFPILGSGLGSFPVVVSYYKSGDLTPNTAGSSVLQWWSEAGATGLGLLGLAGVWCLFRLPRAIARVGPDGRALAFGLLGALVGFGLFSTVHWTVELAAVALVACALGGVLNRWLAGGSDLFVEAI